MKRLPDVLPGHWSTAEGREMAERYAGLTRADLAMADRPDLALANALFLVDGEIVIQTAAKERMRWLSVHHFLAEARAHELQEALVRADQLIEAMSDYIGKMALNANQLSDLNEHWLFMQRNGLAAPKTDGEADG